MHWFSSRYPRILNVLKFSVLLFLPYAQNHPTQVHKDKIRILPQRTLLLESFYLIQWTGRFLKSVEIHSRELKASIVSCFLECYFSICSQFQNQLDYFIFLWFYKSWITFVSWSLSFTAPNAKQWYGKCYQNIHFAFFFMRLNAIGAHLKKKKTKTCFPMFKVYLKGWSKVYADNAFMIELFVY